MPNRTRRQEVILALVNINDKPIRNQSALIKALESEDRIARYYAMRFLRELGPAAQDALPTLRKMRDDVDNSRSRRYIQTAIEAIER